MQLERPNPKADQEHHGPKTAIAQKHVVFSGRSNANGQTIKGHLGTSVPYQRGVEERGALRELPVQNVRAAGCRDLVGLEHAVAVAVPDEAALVAVSVNKEIKV